MASISTIHSAIASAATPTRVLAGGPILEEGRSRVADDGSVFRLIVYDIRGDLHDVGIARAGGGKRQSNIAHRLRCLRGQVSRTDQRTASINGHLASRVDGTPA